MIYSKSRFFILFLTVVSFFVSCTEDETTSLVVGQDFTDTNIRVLEIDTFDVKLSTMKFDRVPTSNSSRLLFGKYTDPDFGEVRAASYFRLSGGNYFIEEGAVLDRVALVMNYDGYFYNDTTQVLNLNLHRLTDKIDAQDGDNDIYNNTQIPYEATPIVSQQFEPRIGRDSLYIELPDDFGADLFSKIQNGQIQDNESLFQELKGLTIQPDDTDNGSVVGFSPNETFIKFYYNTPEDEGGEFEENEEVFELTMDIDLFAYYNNITSDVTGLPLEVIDDQEVNLLSTDSNNNSYMQSGVGYATRIEFPSIRNLFEINGTGTVLNANLRIKPNRDSYSDIKPIDQILGLYLVDQNNDVTIQVFNNIDFVFARLIEENPEFGEIIYNIPVLEFVETKLNEQPITETALILLPFENESRVNSVLFNDAFNEDFEAELTITYAIYED
ncbi:MAG: DUF4270 family protein [Winogradskyella sp.]|uniref:DUF4270 family protein n=1 Tax=Winogradskyella sp. TaxID=1883156 RepID=UPI0025F335A6|nr:DUF4270 family protein [Winogradskyella sp.]NRB60239.1 DUF4270 family protein [Winogradskyella sp.]